MTDLTAVIHELASLFDSMALPYAIMGGIAVRAHGIPRPTFEVDLTLAVPRDRLATLFMQGQLDEAYLRRWAKPLGVAEKLEEALGSDR